MSFVHAVKEALGLSAPVAQDPPQDGRLKHAEDALTEARAELRQGQAVYAASTRLVERSILNQGHSANVNRYLLEGLLGRLRGDARDRDAQDHQP